MISKFINMDYRKIIALSFLIVALSIGYYFVIYIPQKDQEELNLQKQQYDLQQQQIQQQADLQKQKLQQAQEQESNNKQDLNTCLDQASDSYNVEWRTDCRDRDLLPTGCDEADINLSLTDFQKQYKMSGENSLNAWLKYTDQKINVCTCELPMSVASAVNNDLQQAKDTCFKQYPQN